jgi:phospholipid transport system substrate-binding protein
MTSIAAALQGMASLVRRRTLALTVMVVAVSVVADAWAGPPGEQIRLQIDRVVRVLAGPALKTAGRERERQAAVRKIAEEIFDVGEMTRRTLGQHWQGRTDSERAEMVRLFSDLLERVYFTRIANYNGEKITVLKDWVDGDQATVRTRIVTPRGTEIPVDYRMLRRGDHWVAYDVVIEGVSLVANYRAQFNKVIQTSSYQALVEKLRAKAG